MKNLLLKFIFQLFIFSMVLGLSTVILAQFFPGKYFSPVLPWMFPFFFLLTLCGFYLVVKETKNVFFNFINRFMIATFGKMFISVLLLLSYVFTHREDAVPFIISFFLLYIFFTIFEVVSLLKFPYPGKK